MIQKIYCVYWRVPRVNNKFEPVFCTMTYTENEAKDKVKEFSAKYPNEHFYYEVQENIIFDRY